MVAAHAEIDQRDGYNAHYRAGQLLHGLGFAEDELARPVSAFSGGWRIRLNLARALMCPSDLLLLDANPLESIANSKQIAGVMTRGRWLDRKALDAKLDAVAGAFGNE